MKEEGKRGVKGGGEGEEEGRKKKEEIKIENQYFSFFQKKNTSTADIPFPKNPQNMDGEHMTPPYSSPTLPLPFPSLSPPFPLSLPSLPLHLLFKRNQTKNPDL